LILDSSSFSKDYQEDFKNLSVQNRSATVSRSIKHFAIETCAAMDLASLAPNLPVLMTCQASNTVSGAGKTMRHWGSLGYQVDPSRETTGAVDRADPSPSSFLWIF
jgi:hypothetical protein